jgi:outer membrane protein assembly factor BamB
MRVRSSFVTHCTPCEEALMSRSCIRAALIVLGLMAGSLPPTFSADWREFRGPGRTGVSAAKNVPTAWDAGTNILWKAPLPGPGTSSPVLFGKRVYLTCYSGYGLDPKAPGDQKKLMRHLICLNKADGKVVWDAEMPAKTPEPGYSGFVALHGYASSTPAVDADGVYVFYGVSGAAAYSHEGKLKWEKSCGKEYHESWGSAASPVLYKDLVIVHADVESESVFAFDRKTGRELWSRTFKSGRDKQHSRSTPLIVKRSTGDELIVHSRMNWLASLDPATGGVRWEFEGTTNYQNPSPVTDGERIFAVTYKKTIALRADGKKAWSLNHGSEINTPLYHDGHLYWANDGGIAHCVEAKTGKLVYTERLRPEPGRIYASGVLAEGRIYYVSREKGTFVVDSKPKFEQLSHNVIEDDKSIFNATPAIEEGRIYLRSDKYLYCIGKK